MKSVPTTMHMADAMRYVGSPIELPTSNKRTDEYLLCSADLADDRIILGLNSVTMRLPCDQSVRLWTARTKVAHTRCSGQCRKENDHAHSFAAASSLPLHVGAYVFLDGGTTAGPHRLLSATVENDEVVVQFTAEEAIGPIDYKVTVHVPEEPTSTI